MSLSSSDMDGLYLLCICVWSHGPDPRTGFLNCAEIWRWSKNKFQCRYKMPSSLTWRSLTGYGGQNETRLRFLKIVVSVSSRYGLLLWLTSDTGRMAYGLWTLQVAGTSQLLHTNIQTSEQQQCANPNPATRPSVFKKKKNLFLECSFSKSLFQKGTRGNFLLHRNLFTVIWKLLLGNSGLLWPGKSRTSTANTTSNLCPLNLSNIPARTGTRMKARHENPRDLLSLGLQERCKKDMPCPRRQ